MKKIFARSKGFVAGVMVGAMAMVAVPAFADGESISALIDNSIQLMIDNEMKTMPDDYKVLNVEGRTYLPSRYVAEQLGATVEWNEGSRLVRITSPAPKVVEKVVEVPVEVEKIVYVDKDTGDTIDTNKPTDSSKTYRSLPQGETQKHVQLNVEAINNINDAFDVGATRVRIKFTNDSVQDYITVDYYNAVLIAGGQEYKASKAMPDHVDQKLAGEGIAPDSDYTGFISFPRVNDTSIKDFTIKVPVRLKTNETLNFEIDFSGSLK